MRHQRVINHLGRTSSHRKAMLANMAVSLIMNKRITTTTAKAKALRSYIEPLITRSKEDTTHSRRMVFRYLQDKKAVAELFREISPKVAERPGGYTRILKTGNRIGDNAEMCIIELVDFNEARLAAETKPAKTTTRRRRSPKKKTAAVEETGVKETGFRTETPTVDATGEVTDTAKPDEADNTGSPAGENENKAE